MARNMSPSTLQFFCFAACLLDHYRLRLPPMSIPDAIVEHVVRTDEEELVDVAAWGDIPIVSTFGEPQTEYAALHKACGLMARGDVGVIEAVGEEALSFLNNLLTNGLIQPETKQPMPVGTGCHSFFLNLRGRVVADPIVVRTGDNSVLMTVSRPLVKILVETLDLFRFAEKVKLRDVSDEQYVLSLVGPTADAVLADAADTTPTLIDRPDDFPATSFVAASSIKFSGSEAVVVADGMTRLLIVPKETALSLWQDLTTRFGDTLDDRRFGQRRLRPVGWAMYNAWRIERGVPVMGVDFAPAPPSRPGPKKDEDAPDMKGGVLPAETGPLFERCVSVTSGCYLGQEVVARMHARKVQARNIVGIKMDEDALPSAGAPVEVDDADVGQVTSSTLSPVRSAAVLALATVKRPHFEVGTKVTVPAEGRHAKATVVALPFV